MSKDKPVFDEQTLAKVLEAAYVLQEHHRAQHKPKVPPQEHPREDLTAKTSAGKTSVAKTSAAKPHDSPAPEAGPGSPVPDEYAATLAQIVETQRQIQERHLIADQALTFAAARAAELTKAGGAAIAILDGRGVRYRAATGKMTLPVGTAVPMDKALCLECLRTGQIIRCEDVNPDFLLDTAECRRRGIQSMIAVPIYGEGVIAGALEVYYDTTEAFTEHDVHTCQLMAGVITETLAAKEVARREEACTEQPPASVEAQQAAMLEALEELKPDLYTLVDKHVVTDSPAFPAAHSAEGFVCLKCGHQLVGEEQFCGNCGSPRTRDYERPSMQSKVAAMWRMQEAMNKGGAKVGNREPAREEVQETPREVSRDDAREGIPEPVPATPVLSEKPLAESIEHEMPEFFAAPELRMGHPAEAEPSTAKPREESSPQVLAIALETKEKETKEDEQEAEAEVTQPPSEAAALASPEPTANWTSAAAARAFLEQLAGARRPGAVTQFWSARRGDIYLAIAVILVAAVIRWGIWSNHSVRATTNPPATAHHKTDPNADLSLFDRMLISLGLAEAPSAPEYKGNPDTQVWIDLHTALYYCPGTDLYGKTPKGRYATQRSAQLDQFEPAYRRVCE